MGNLGEVQRGSLFMVKKTIEMQQSLINAVQEAGGSAVSFSDWESLSTMTVAELLVQLGANNIRFVYKK